MATRSWGQPGPRLWATDSSSRGTCAFVCLDLGRGGTKPATPLRGSWAKWNCVDLERGWTHVLQGSLTLAPCSPPGQSSSCTVRVHITKEICIHCGNSKKEWTTHFHFLRFLFWLQTLCLFVPCRFDRIAHTKETMLSDGLNSLTYMVLEVQRYPLYTKITVDIGTPS